MNEKTKGENIKLCQSLIMDIGMIEPNKGQIAGLPSNPRLIRDERFKKLKKSLETNPEMTAYREILVYPLKTEQKTRYIIIGGNMRYRAMKEIGFNKCICKVLPEETTVEQLQAYTIKDNAGYGEWDFTMLSSEWSEQLLIDCCIDIPEMEEPKMEEEAEEDNYDVSQGINKTPHSRLGDIYQLGQHRLVCGDSTKPETFAALMNGVQADLIVTDPPYNVNYESADGKKIENDHMADAAFQEFLFDAFTQGNDNLKQGGAVYIWHADTEGYNFRAACKRVGWKVRQCLIWKKNALVLGRQDYQWIHEPCLYLWKEGAGHYFINRRDLTTVVEDGASLDIDKMTKQEMKELLEKMLHGSIPTTIIEENKPAKSAEHPTMKPLKLIGQQIRNSSRPGEVVLDLFGGSGSTMMAAEQLGRKCYMVEFDPKYVDVIVNRWEELTKEQARYIGNFIENNVETEKQ